MGTVDHEPAPRRAQADLDELLAAGTEIAVQKLAKHGDFAPFGGAIKLDGEIHMIASQLMIPEGEEPTTADLRALCRATLHRKRDRVRAAGVISLTADGGQKVILVELDHADGVSRNVTIPFERGFFNHRVKLGPRTTEPAPPFVWT